MKAEIIRHGEAILYPVSALPKDAQLKEVTNEAILAHSETGHHHLLKTKTKNAVKIYTTLDGNTFVEVGNIAELVHKKTGKDVHRTIPVAPSIYKIIQKREFDYFQKAIRQVMD